MPTGCPEFRTSGLEEGHGLAKHTGCKVRISERHVHALMPEKILDGLEGGASADEMARKGMSQLVPADSRQARELASTSESVAGERVGDGTPGALEHGAGCLSLRSQGRDDLGREWDVSNAVVFRRVDVSPNRCPTDAEQVRIRSGNTVPEARGPEAQIPGRRRRWDGNRRRSGRGGLSDGDRAG